MTEESVETRYLELQNSAASAEKPNYTQYQYAIAELDAKSMGATRAYRRVRNLMEKSFGLESLDDIVDGKS